MSGQPRIRHGHQGRWLQCQSKQDMAQRAARRSCYVRGVWPHRDATERAVRHLDRSTVRVALQVLGDHLGHWDTVLAPEAGEGHMCQELHHVVPRCQELGGHLHDVAPDIFFKRVLLF
eukprot:scaffold927_cov375-Prasinococcus_capsulatus_cf.AAC.5